jgi:hypothetical protein
MLAAQCAVVRVGRRLAAEVRGQGQQLGDWTSERGCGIGRDMKKRLSGLAVRAVSILLTSVGLAACGGAPAEPAEPTAEPSSGLPSASGLGEDDSSSLEPELVSTGIDCATAEAICDAGKCVAEIRNDCEKAVTCELSIVVICGTGTDVGQAKGKGRDTFAAGSKGPLETVKDCEGQVMQSTQIDVLSCK